METHTEIDSKASVVSFVLHRHYFFSSLRFWIEQSLVLPKSIIKWYQVPLTVKKNMLKVILNVRENTKKYFNFKSSQKIFYFVVVGRIFCAYVLMYNEYEMYGSVMIFMMFFLFLNLLKSVVL